MTPLSSSLPKNQLFFSQPSSWLVYFESSIRREQRWASPFGFMSLYVLLGDYMKSPPSHILEICVPVCMFVCLCVCVRVARLYKGTDCVMLIKKTGYCPSQPVAFHQMLLFSSFMLVVRGGGLSCLDIHCSACEGLCVFHPASFLSFFFFFFKCVWIICWYVT